MFAEGHGLVSKKSGTALSKTPDGQSRHGHSLFRSLVIFGHAKNGTPRLVGDLVRSASGLLPEKKKNEVSIHSRFFTYSFLASVRRAKRSFCDSRLAAKAIRRRADIECVGRLITKSPDSEAILTAKNIRRISAIGAPRIATIQAQASEVEPGQTFTVVDADGAP